MKKVLHVGVIAFFLCASSIFAQDTQNWTNPAIKGYGDILYSSKLALQPSAKEDYKVVFKVTSSKEKNGVNAQLWHMARLVNLLTASGVSRDHMHIVGIVSGDATPTILNNATYEKNFKTDNPNLNLIEALKKVGVKVYVCSQAVAEHHFNIETDVDKDVIKTLSALTDLIYFQQKGYALIQ